LKSFQAEKDKSTLEEDIQVLEDTQAEDLAEEEEENVREALKAIRKRKAALDSRMKMELDKVLDPDISPELREVAKEKLAQVQRSYSQIVDDEGQFEEKLSIKRSATEEEIKNLEKDREEQEKANEEDRKIINDKDAMPAKKKAANERLSHREEEIRRITTKIEGIE